MQPSRNLIVNYLPLSVTSDDLETMFSPYGPIEQRKVVKNEHGNSCGYGFVLYSHIKDAESAVRNLNGARIHNKTIKVSFAQPRGQKRTNKNTILYVSKLPLRVTEGHLYDLFRPFEGVITIRLLYNNEPHHSSSKGVAFVKFVLHRQASAAMAALNGYVISGYPDSRPICITYATVTEDAPRAKVPSIFIYNLPTEITQSGIYEMFSRYGTVDKVDDIRDGDTNFLKYAFVHMPIYSEAHAAISSLDGSFVGVNKLQVRF